MLSFFVNSTPRPSLSPDYSAPPHPSQWSYLQTGLPPQNKPFIFHCLRTLLFYVGLKSFVCRSYEKHGGVPGVFPIWNSVLATGHLSLAAASHVCHSYEKMPGRGGILPISERAAFLKTARSLPPSPYLRARRLPRSARGVNPCLFLQLATSNFRPRPLACGALLCVSALHFLSPRATGFATFVPRIAPRQVRGFFRPPLVTSRESPVTSHEIRPLLPYLITSLLQLPKSFHCHTSGESACKSNHCHTSKNPFLQVLCLPHIQDPGGASLRNLFSVCSVLFLFLFPSFQLSTFNFQPPPPARGPLVCVLCALGGLCVHSCLSPQFLSVGFFSSLPALP